MPQSTNNSVNPRGLFGLFKGAGGVGKSVGALSFPTPYVLDSDRKMPSIAQKHFPGKKIDWDTFSDIFQVSERIEDFIANGCPYETIIGDTITSLSYSALKTIDDVKGQNIISRLRSFNSEKKSKAGKDSSIELRGYDYYNGEDDFLKYFLDRMKFLWARDGNPKHVIIIAHVLTSESQNIKTGIVTVTKRIVTAGAKIGAYIPAQFDNEWTFGMAHPDLDSVDQKMRRICLTESIGDDAAKCSYPLPAKIDFTGGNLYDEICKYVDFNVLPLQNEEYIEPGDLKLIS